MENKVKIFLLDTGVLGDLCHPEIKVAKPKIDLLADRIERKEIDVFLPEVTDYELRRKFLHLAMQSHQQTSRRLKRLDRLKGIFDYLPVTTEDWHKAAEIWAKARFRGERTAGDNSIDADVILAAHSQTYSPTNRYPIVESGSRHSTTRF